MSYSSGHAYLKYTGERDAREKDIPRVSKVLPALVFSLQTIDYDPMRKPNARERISNSVPNGDGSTLNYVFGRVPYDIGYEVAIKTKNMDDMLQILEQIIPYFDPNLVVQMDDASGANLNLCQDVSIILQNVQVDDIYEGDLEEHRAIEATLNFQLKGWLYKRVLQGAVANRMKVNFTTTSEDGMTLEEFFTQTGQETYEQEVAREMNNTIGDSFGDLGGHQEPEDVVPYEEPT